MGQEYNRRVLVMGQVPRLGNIILYDDFEDLFKWIGAGDGSEVVEKYGTAAFNGNYSMRIETRTTGATQGDYASAARYGYILPARRVTCEWLFTFDGLTNIQTVTMEAIHTDGVNAHYAGIRYNQQTHKWFYYGDGPGWVQIDTPEFYAQSAAWNRISVTWNMLSQKYEHLYVNATDYDLSAYKYYKYASAGVSYLNFYFTVITNTAAAARCLFDDVLLLAE